MYSLCYDKCVLTHDLCTGFADQSALLKHELAYCLGQMRLASALPVLESVLENLEEDPMVRHEVSLHRQPLSYQFAVIPSH
jgi:hypothetical protein